MRKAQLALAALTLGIAVVAVTAEARQSPAPKKAPADLKAGLAAEAKLKEATVEKLLRAMGPVFKEQLRAGRQVELPGVGTFRVVRINEYKDLVDGRPALIPARNYVEFIPVDALNEAANAKGAVPARTVEGYEFRVNPNSTPGQKTEGTRTPRTRTR